MNDQILYNDNYSRKVLNFDGKNTYKFRIRLKQLLKLSKFGKKEKVLEIGANRGELVKEMMKYGDDVIGVDFNADAVKLAGSDRIIFMNAENLDFPNSYFDKIVSIHAIEHIPDIQKAINEMSRVLKNNGEAVLIYPLEPIRGIAAMRDAILAYHDILKARKLHIHKLTPKKIGTLISGTNLKIGNKGIYFEPFPCYFTVLKKVGFG